MGGSAAVSGVRPYDPRVPNRSLHATESRSSKSSLNPAPALERLAATAGEWKTKVHSCDMEDEPVGEHVSAVEKSLRSFPCGAGCDLRLDFVQGEGEGMQLESELSTRFEHTMDLRQRNGDVHIRKRNPGDHKIEGFIRKRQMLALSSNKLKLGKAGSSPLQSLLIDVDPDHLNLRLSHDLPTGLQLFAQGVARSTADVEHSKHSRSGRLG